MMLTIFQWSLILSETTLQQAIDLCRGKIKSNIELKCVDPQFIKNVIVLLEENNMISECVITSLDYEVLQEVKQCNTMAKTGYITTIAYGKIGGMEYVDIFSIETSFATKVLVGDIHQKNKEVFVWTVNNKSEIQRAFDLGVDTNVTDNPYRASLIWNSAFAGFVD